MVEKLRKVERLSAAALIVFVLAACGGGEKPKPPAPYPTPTPTATPRPTATATTATPTPTPVASPPSGTPEPSATPRKTLTLEWDPNSETNLAGYKLYVCVTSGGCGSWIDLGKITRTSAPVLAQPTFYTVTAYNTAGLESAPSNEVKWP